MTFWQKQFLGPLKKLSCRDCGTLVSVPWAMSAFVIIIASTIASVGPFVAAVTAWNQFDPVSAALTFIGSLAIVASIMAWVYIGSCL